MKQRMSIPCCGFTLIELLVFIVITSISVVAIVPFFMQTLKDTLTMRDMSLASLLANETMEEAKALCAYGAYTIGMGVGTPTPIPTGTAVDTTCSSNSLNTSGTDLLSLLFNTTTFPASETIYLPSSANKLATFTRTVEIYGASTTTVAGVQSTTTTATYIPASQGCVCLSVKVTSGKILASLPQAGDAPRVFCK